MGNICTRSGKLVDPWELNPQDIDFTDVAWALSHIVRFAGHVDRAWTVADHTLFVARILRLWGLPKRVQLLGLIHDAGEAYLQDLPSPVKAHVPDYKEAEHRAEKSIERAAGLGAYEWQGEIDGKPGMISIVGPHYDPVLNIEQNPVRDLEREWVKRADIVALVVEAERMLPPGAWKVDQGWDAIVRNAGAIESGHRAQIHLTRWELLRPRWLTRRAWRSEFRRLQRAA